MTTDVRPWVRHEWSGSAADFHAKDFAGAREVWICHVSAPALILGSSQPETDVDRDALERAGVSLVRRRSGGGAVFVHPDDTIWIDVTIGRDDPLWLDDISKSMLWLGDAFVRAVAPWADASTYEGAYVAGEDGRVVCFASASPGEVFVGDHKLVGISQRRGRGGARFQCMLHRVWKPSDFSFAFADAAVRARAERIEAATVEVTTDEMVTSLLLNLPA